MTEPRYTVGTVAIDDIHVGAAYENEIYDRRADPYMPLATCDTPEEARTICDLLNAGEAAKALWDAVAGIGAFRVGRYSTDDPPMHYATQWTKSNTVIKSADTPQAAIIALWRAVQGEEGRG